MASKKLFSLLHNTDVELRPGEKIIPARSLASLAASQELLAAVQKDAIEYRKEIATEIETERERAEEKGFDDGLQTWAAQVFQLEAEVSKLREGYEKLIAKVAVKAAQTVVGKQLVEHPEIFADIVANTLKAVSQHRRIIIHCSRHDDEILEANKPRLKALFEQLDVLSIQVKSELPAGGYTIETERGIINNSEIDKVWRALEKAFASQLNSGNPPV